MAELTPMMKQYLQIKEQNQDAIPVSYTHLRAHET